MNNARRMGGFAGIVAAATFAIGFVMAGTVLSDYALDEPEPAEAVQFLVDNQWTYYAWNTIIFIVFGAALMVLALALYNRLGRSSIIA